MWEDPTIILDISCTDEKHNLYLNSIEEDFIKRLYEQGRYIYSCKRQEAEWITTYVLSKGLHEVGIHYIYTYVGDFLHIFVHNQYSDFILVSYFFKAISVLSL